MHIPRHFYFQFAYRLLIAVALCVWVFRPTPVFHWIGSSPEAHSSLVRIYIFAVMAYVFFYVLVFLAHRRPSVLWEVVPLDQDAVTQLSYLLLLCLDRFVLALFEGATGGVLGGFLFADFILIAQSTLLLESLVLASGYWLLSFMVFLALYFQTAHDRSAYDICLYALIAGGVYLSFLPLRRLRPPPVRWLARLLEEPPPTGPQSHTANGRRG